MSCGIAKQRPPGESVKAPGSKPRDGGPRESPRGYSNLTKPHRVPHGKTSWFGHSGLRLRASGKERHLGELTDHARKKQGHGRCSSWWSIPCITLLFLITFVSLRMLNWAFSGTGHTSIPRTLGSTPSTKNTQSIITEVHSYTCPPPITLKGRDHRHRLYDDCVDHPGKPCNVTDRTLTEDFKTYAQSSS